MTHAERFLKTLEGADAFFRAEPAAVSVLTEHFGTLDRADVARLLPLARNAVAHEAAHYRTADALAR